MESQPYMPNHNLPEYRPDILLDPDDSGHTPDGYCRPFADRYSRLAKLLYNAALFRIRQVFTGWDKEERTNLEKSVFAEIQCAKETYKGFTCRRVLSYKALDKILRANKNPDFFAGLPMQTA